MSAPGITDLDALIMCFTCGYQSDAGRGLVIHLDGEWDEHGHTDSAHMPIWMLDPGSPHELVDVADLKPGDVLGTGETVHHAFHVTDDSEIEDWGDFGDGQSRVITDQRNITVGWPGASRIVRRKSATATPSTTPWRRERSSVPTQDTTIVYATEWDNAYDMCAHDWTGDTPRLAADLETAVPNEDRRVLAEDTPALLSVHTRHGNDSDVVRACLLAAQYRFGTAWTVRDLHTVAAGFRGRFNGWTEIAHQYLDDHYPGLPERWLIDLETIGQDLKRDSEQYITLIGDPGLYVFDRMHTEPAPNPAANTT